MASCYVPLQQTLWNFNLIGPESHDAKIQNHKETAMETNLNQHEVIIKKASGETEAFDVGKLKTSLKNAGADGDAIAEIAADIESWVYSGATTAKIYARAYRMFKQRSTSGALLYKLKEALNSMGPSGYPFERFIAELFKMQGYEVKVGQIIEGASVSHEMDVIATKDKEQHLMECKFSHNQGKSVSIQVPLYVHSRVNDIVEKLQDEQRYKGMNFEAWIVTNGRFSPDSIEYSRLKKINLLGWDFPKNSGLKDLMERQRIFPITILTHLNKNEKQKLMAEGIVTCAQLMQQPGRLDQLGVSEDKQRSVTRELEEVARLKKNGGVESSV